MNRSTTTRRRTWAIVPAVLALALSPALAACGDDDGDENGQAATTTEAPASSSTTAADEVDPEAADYCDAVLAIETAPEPEVDFESLTPEQQTEVAMQFGSDLQPLAQDALAAAPDEISADIEVLAAATDELARTGNFDAFGTPEVEAAQERSHAFDRDNCGWERVDVTGVDYAFEGLPSELPAGPATFEFTNDAAEEDHELIVLRKNEGTTESAEDLLALPEEEATGKVTEVAVASAEPGESDYGVADLEPGDYIAACFIPVGGEGDGPDHAEEGMIAEFTVS